MREQFGYKSDIEIDGGVSPKNVELLKDAGTDVVVAGNAVFKSEDPSLTIRQMQI